MAKSYLALGRLRRDTEILGTGTQEEITQMAKDAVRQGRMAEVFVIAITGHFTESKVDWAEDPFAPAETAAVAATPAPALNPSTGPQPEQPEPAKAEGETIEGNRQEALEENRSDTNKPTEAAAAADTQKAALGDGKKPIDDELKHLFGPKPATPGTAEEVSGEN